MWYISHVFQSCLSKPSSDTLLACGHSCNRKPRKLSENSPSSTTYEVRFSSSQEPPQNAIATSSEKFPLTFSALSDTQVIKWYFDILIATTSTSTTQFDAHNKFSFLYGLSGFDLNQSYYSIKNGFSLKPPPKAYGITLPPRHKGEVNSKASAQKSTAPHWLEVL